MITKLADMTSDDLVFLRTSYTLFLEKQASLLNTTSEVIEHGVARIFNRPIVDEDKLNDLKQLTIREMQERYSVSRYQVEQWRKDYNIKTKTTRGSWNKKELTQEQIDDLNNPMLKNKELAKKYGVSQTTISSWRRKSMTQRRYAVDMYSQRNG